LRVLNPDGTYKTDELDTGAASMGDESSPVLADTADGGVGLFWQGAPTFTEPFVVMGRFFGPSAQPYGDPFVISPGDFGYEGMPSAAAFHTGEIFVSWKTRQSGFTTGPSKTMGVRISATGDMTGSQIHLLGDDPSGAYPFYAPVAIAGAGRAAITWHTVDPVLDGTYLRRYYAEDDVIDCDITDVSGPIMPGEAGGRRLPAVLGFEDGRILVAWETTYMDPAGGGTITRAYLRYLK